MDMNGFSRETRQMLDEIRNETLTAANVAFAKGAESITTLAQAAAKNLETNFAEFGARSKLLGVSTARVVNALEGQGDRFERLNTAISTASNSLDAISTGADAAGATLAMLDAQATAIVAQQVAARVESAAMTSMLETHAKAVADLETAIKTMQASVIDGLAELKTVPSAALKIATETLSAAAAQMQGEVAQLGKASRELLAGIKDELVDSARAVKAHNAAIEDDLARSRSNVSKVHGALVEMTGTLVSQLAERTVQ
jgi:chromosome segregation ATPase